GAIVGRFVTDAKPCGDTWSQRAGIGGTGNELPVKIEAVLECRRIGYERSVQPLPGRQRIGSDGGRSTAEKVLQCIVELRTHAKVELTSAGMPPVLDDRVPFSRQIGRVDPGHTGHVIPGDFDEVRSNGAIAITVE